MKKTAVTMMVAGSLVTATPVLAAETYAIDPAHTWVTFSTNHAGWSNARGLFRTVSGEIKFDKADVSKSSVKVSIDANSIDTNFANRDKHLRSPDFLNVTEFPAVTFTSTSVTKTGDRSGKVTGDLTMLGITKPVTLDVTWNEEKPLPWNASVIATGFTAKGVVNGADYIKTLAKFGLGPEIRVEIDIEAQKK